VVEKDFLRRILDMRGIKIQESNESSGTLQFVCFFFLVFLSLPLEHRAAVKRFVSLQFLDLIDSR
jgi:hypothetical protein